MTILFCFHHAGGSASMYYNLKIENYEIYPISLGNRETNKNGFATSCQEAALQIFNEIKHKLENNKYIFFGHSLGSWIAYELLLLIIKNNLPQPLKFIVSAFPSPYIKDEEKPWLPNNELDDNEFQKELLGWDINKKVFINEYWKIFSDRLRHDCALFDQYIPSEKENISCMITAILPNNDKRITEKMINNWKYVTTNSFELIKVEGHHFYLLDNINIIKKFI